MSGLSRPSTRGRNVVCWTSAGAASFAHYSPREAVMLFPNTFPLDALASFCRMLRHGLGAGLSLVDVFRQQARRGPPPLRPTVERIASRLDQGDSLEDALKAEGDRLPALFISMAVVGEQTGYLPEAFAELERY